MRRETAIVALAATVGFILLIVLFVTTNIVETKAAVSVLVAYMVATTGVSILVDGMSKQITALEIQMSKPKLVDLE